MKRRSPCGFTLPSFIPKFILILFILSGLQISIQAQVDVTSSGGTPMASYTTLSAAFAAVNAGTHTGVITMNISANTSEPATGAILNASGTGSASFTSVLIKPTGGAARIISGAATAGLPLIDLNGCDNVTIDGLNSGGNSLTINNTTISATSGTSTIRFVNDATLNLITRCTINGSSTMTTTTNGGTIYFATAFSTATNGNDNNTISFCKIGSPDGVNLPAKAIYSQGTTTNVFNYNSNNTITDCEVFDYFNATAQSNGMYIAGGTTDWMVTNNKWYQTAPRTQTTGAQHTAIQIANTNTNNFVISGNIIGFSSASGTGVYTLSGPSTSTRFFGIHLSSHGSNSATLITNNLITAVNVSGPLGGVGSAGPLIGIIVGSGKANITNNTIGSLNGTTTFGINSTGTSTSEVIALYNFASGFNGILLTGNTIGSIYSTNTSTGAAGITAIRLLNATEFIVDNNTIGASGGAIKATTTSTLSGQGASLYGIVYSGVTGMSVQNNTIRNFFTNSPNLGVAAASTIFGIAGLTASQAQIVSNNHIHTLYNTNLTAATSVIGIYNASTFVGGSTFSKNKIHSLGILSNNAAATLTGIFQNGGAILTYSNNMIRLGIDSAGLSMNEGIMINGINDAAGAVNYFHNSVYIGGSAVNSNASNTFAFNSSVVTNVRFFINNIFYNARSNSGSTGKHYAVKVGGTTPNPAGLTINYNDYLANGIGGFVGQYNSIDQFDINAWRTAVGQDCNSFSSDPKYINPTGTNITGDLHIMTGVPTPIEQAGFNASAYVADDIDGQIRSSFTPHDIGADAANFLSLDVSGPAIEFTPLASACGTGDVILTPVTIYDATGVPTAGTFRPRVYYRKNAGAWFSNAGILLTGNGMNGTWSFTMLASDMGGLVIGDIVDYYVIAQDLAVPSNIASNPCGAFAIDVNTVITAPTVPFSITVQNPMSGTFTVGVGGNYTTITAAVADYNTRCVSGPVLFSLTDATYPSETFPITINAVSGQSAVNTLTIKPAAGVNVTVSGVSATAIFVLNGADYVTINGSNGSLVNSICPLVTATRNLTINNTSTSTTSAVVWLQWVSVNGIPNSPTNNNILNCNIVGNSNTTTLFGIGSGSITIATGSLGYQNNNNSFINNNISKTQYGIFSNGQSKAVKNTGNTINQNLINTAAPDNVQIGGIWIGFDDGSKINGNNISGMTRSSSVFAISAGFPIGSFGSLVFVGSEVTNVTISHNIIGFLSSTGSFSTVGIGVASASTGSSLISNNMISGLLGFPTPNDFDAGIWVGGGNGVMNIYNNSISMLGARGSATQPSYCIAVGGVFPNVNIKNNIMTNSQTSASTGRSYAIGLAYNSTTGNYLNLISDYNDMFTSGSSAGFSKVGGILQTAGYEKLTLAEWQAETGKDKLSQNVQPTFVSTTDLHLTGAGNDCLNQAGMPLAAVPSDIDCETRSLTNPDIGADEFVGTDLTITITESSGVPNDKTICNGASATVTVGGGVAHKWNTGQTTAAIVVNPSSTTIYADTVTNSVGCKIVMYDTVKVLPLPPAAITPANVTICSGKSTTLTASGGGTYAWSTGAVTTAITVSPSSTTTYTVTVTSANGCTATATATVTVNLSPTASISPSAPILCSGSIQTLTASGGGTYAWSTGAVTSVIMVSPASTTTYTVTVTAANGCTATATATVTVITGVSIAETHVEPTSCSSTDGSINITATGAAPLTYSWSTSDGFGTFNPTSEDQSGIGVGTYNVTVTSGNGCTATKSIALVGPGNCGGCPSIGSLTSSTSNVCKTINFTLTASGLANMGGTYGIVFKSSPTMLPDPYVGGTILGTVANGSLTGGGTVATLVTNIAVPSSYFLYAIVTPNPPNPGCRPSATTTITVYSCTPSITDPCSCKNNATTLINGQFNETITVNAPAGQNWTVSAVTGLYLITSPNPPTPPVIIPIGTALVNGTLDGINNDGDGQIDEPDENVYYTLKGIHVDALGYNVTVTNSLGSSGSIGSTCYYPNPSIVGLATVYCQYDPPVPLVGNAQLGDGSGPATGVGTFTINGSANTVFNPSILGPGTHNVVFSFDAADGVPNGSHPGCIQAVSQSVVVNQTPSVTPVANRIFCVGQTSSLITFTGAPAGAVFNWTRTPEAIGLAATSGSGSVPAFVTTNAGNTPLTSTFTVTPSFTNAGKTCLGTPMTFTITVNPNVMVNQIPDVQYCHGDVTVPIVFTGFAPGTTFNWTRTPEPIGLAATAGTNSVPSFVTTNPSAARITSTFTVTPVYTNVTGGPVCMGTPMIFRISVLPQPVARCKDATIFLDQFGKATLTVPDVDNGSTAFSLSLSKTSFDCSNQGANTVTLTARDSCGKSSTCMATVTVRDIIPPVLWCPKDWTVNLNPGECDRIINYTTPEATDNCNLIRTTTTATITTAFNSNNQFAGNMFNITNTSTGPITLTSFAGNIIGTVGGTCTASVYYTPTTYIGKESNAAAWTLMGTGNGTCAGLNQPTLFPTIGGLVINPGETYGIFFYLDSYGTFTLRYTNGNTTFSNGDLTLTLGVGKGNPVFTGTTFAGRYWNGIIGYSKETIIGAGPVVTQIDNSGKKNGDVFPRGTTCQTYQATDFAGNTTTCTFCITIAEYANPLDQLVCHDEIQISLNENCVATIGADEILSGGPYGCLLDYIVTVQDWITGQAIDRQPNIPGIQVGSQDINKEFKVTITDPATGNSCWGHARVEDKIAPRMICPRDTCITCGTSLTTPFYMGTPVVTENCGSYSLTYSDNVSNGSCALNYQELIVRTWTAVDAQGNRAECVQVIRVALATLNSVSVPADYDDLDEPALSCDGKINTTKDYTPHYLAYPYCVDGYLLDSAHWLATGGFFPSPQGDLAGERRPRVLGWNCIDTGLYIGHPSPFEVYYPAHPSWRPNNPLCWGPDEVIMWQGTGYPSGGGCINLGITFNDIKIDVSAPNCDAGAVGCYKIIRQWTVLDWCTGQVGGKNQLIKVIDREGPQVLYPDTVIVNMEELKCFGVWEVPKPWLIDNCSNDIHYSIKVTSGAVTGNETDGFVVRNIERGLSTATIIAEDCCGNVTKHRVAINVLDNTPPVAVCNKTTIVSITGNQSPGENFAKIFANDFDQGSFDNCSDHIFFKVIRMEQLRGTNNGSNSSQPDNGTNCSGVNGDDNAILDGNQIYFDDYVNFCCSDVGKTIMVVLRVYDIEPGKGPISPSRMNPGGNLFNHYSDCMIEVEVQDKALPTVVPPPNIVVSCWFWFDVDKLDDPNDATFGRVVSDLSLRHKVVTNDLVCYNYCVRNDITGYPGFVPGAPPSNPPAWNKACDYYRVYFDTSHPERKYELVWGFDGTVLGTCGVNYSISVNDNRECGQGQLTRTIVARGLNGVSVTATQTIWVVDCDPFYINRADDCDALDDITWPGNCDGQATTIDGCGADISPDNPILGRPVIENHADDLCSLISIEYFDELFTVEPDACFKVLRTWVVIDWCQYDPNLDPTRGRWEYLQIIKVHDTDKPEISVSIGNCESAFKNQLDQLCYGHISLTADATDNCSPLDWLFYDYKIDIYNDGKGIHSGFDYAVGPLTRKDFAGGKTPIKHHNPQAEDENNPFDASGTYPVGVHKICWYVEDGCGNLAANCQLFEIKDCKAPTPYCELGVITTVMPSTGCITIWAKDLDRGSFDNCTEKDNLKFYFDGDPSLTSITICCDDFTAAGVNDELIKEVRLWVEDEEGNTDFCVTAILVQDYQNVCPNVGTIANISGELKTESDQTTEKVDTRLYHSGVMMKRMTTSTNGFYFFGDLAYGSSASYLVQPKRNDDPLNGVSTADIVKIQRHILGIETLDSPYKLIASDVNNTKNVTAADVSEIRKLILGVTDRFAKNESWTFIPSDYVFPDKLNPWSAPRDVLVNVTDPIAYHQNFVSVKFGDVTNNARAHNLDGTTQRSNGKLHFEIDNGKTVAGELYRVEFKSSDFENIIGYQFTLKFDNKNLRFESIEGGALNVDQANFGTNHTENGILTTSWNHKTAQSIGKDAVLFSVVFRALSSESIGGLMAITGDVTSAEAYDSDLNIKDLSLSVRTDKGVVESGIFELYQNTPNPFDKETVIHFRLPETGAAKLSIYDIHGKVIRMYDVVGNKGMNSIKIDRSELNVSGVLYYQLDAQNHSATKQMILMN